MWFFSRDPLKDFAYELGAKVPEFEDKSIWSLHEGTKKANGEKVSIFSFEVNPLNEHHLPLAKGAFKRLKTLRHPNFIVFLDGLETEKSCYIVTESVVPLASHIRLELLPSDTTLQKHAISWGLHQIAKALDFLSKDCNLCHNNLNLWSVFVDEAGEWRVGGLEYALPSTSTAPYSIPLKGLSYLDKYDPPEKSSARRGEKWSGDMWGLGCLVWEIFNGEFSKNTALKEPEKIPKDLVKVYCQLVGANPKSRPSPAVFLQTSAGGYLKNEFVECMQFIEEIQMKDDASKSDFFSSLSAKVDTFPLRACKHKLLPRLREALEFGNDSSSILNPLFKLGKLLSTEEFQRTMVAVVIKLFSSPDRATRVKLLQQMEIFGEHLPAPVVNQQIFPSIATGFHDTNPVVREQTVKSMLHIACKLDYKNLNEELMKHFARLQSKDAQGGIRTNTTICLGKIACYLHPQVRQKVLVSAFTRAFKDPFPSSRQAAVMGFLATQRFFSLQETAQRILPSLCPLTTDPDKTVRDQAFKTMRGFLSRLEQYSEDPEKQQELEKDVLAGGGSGGMADVAGWAGWAVSGVTSLTSKLYKGDKAKAVTTTTTITTTTTTTTTIATASATTTTTSAAATVTDKKGEKLKGVGEGKKEVDGWEDEDWGEMNTTAAATNTSRQTTGTTEDDFGKDWDADDDDDDDDDWDALEQQDNLSNNSQQPPATTTSSTSTKITVKAANDGLKPASSYDWQGGKPSLDDPFGAISSSNKGSSLASDSFGDWNEDVWSEKKQKEPVVRKSSDSVKEIPTSINSTKSLITHKNPPPTKPPSTKPPPTKPPPTKPPPTKHPLKLTAKTKSPPEPDFFSDGW